MPSERELVEAYGMLAFGRKRNGDPDWSSIPATEAEARRAIDRIKAEAWDEGLASAEYDHVSGRIIADTPNPYQKEASDDERTRIEVRNEGTERFPRFVAEWDGVEVKSNNAFGLDSALDLAGAPRPRDLVLVEEEASDD